MTMAKRGGAGIGAGRTGALVRMGIWALLVLGLDRASKILVIRSISPGESVPVWRGVFHLTHVRNPGAAFGILPGWDGLLVALPVVLTVAAVWVLPALAGRYRHLPLAGGLIVGGSLGNLIDRLAAGLVTDFLDFRVWPVFNLADAFIVAGAGILLLSLVRGEAR